MRILFESREVLSSERSVWEEEAACELREADVAAVLKLKERGGGKGSGCRPGVAVTALPFATMLRLPLDVLRGNAKVLSRGCCFVTGTGTSRRLSPDIW